VRLFNLLLVSGFLRLPDKPTPLPDEKDGPSSGLSRTSSGQQLEPDDNKYLTYAGYSGHRRVCRVLYPISIAVAGSSLANCILDVRN
jgi:hypothetical protein